MATGLTLPPGTARPGPRSIYGGHGKSVSRVFQADAPVCEECRVPGHKCAWNASEKRDRQDRTNCSKALLYYATQNPHSRHAQNYVWAINIEGYTLENISPSNESIYNLEDSSQKLHLIFLKGSPSCRTLCRPVLHLVLQSICKFVLPPPSAVTLVSFSFALSEPGSGRDSFP